MSRDKHHFVNMSLERLNFCTMFFISFLTEKLTDFLSGIKEYIAKEPFQRLFDRGLQLVTKLKVYEKYMNLLSE